MNPAHRKISSHSLRALTLSWSFGRDLYNVFREKVEFSTLHAARISEQLEIQGSQWSRRYMEEQEDIIGGYSCIQTSREYLQKRCHYDLVVNPWNLLEVAPNANPCPNSREWNAFPQVPTHAQISSRRWYVRVQPRIDDPTIVIKCKTMPQYIGLAGESVHASPGRLLLQPTIFTFCACNVDWSSSLKVTSLTRKVQTSSQKR